MSKRSNRSRPAPQAGADADTNPPSDPTLTGAATATADSIATGETMTGSAERPPEGGETLSGTEGETLTGAATPPAIAAPDGNVAGTNHSAIEGDGDAGQAQGVAQDQAVDAGAALAPEVEAQLQAQARETLIGTIGEWADSGAREIVRVAGLVAEHGNWTIDELEQFGAAFNRVALEAMSSAELVKVQRNAERLLDLSSDLEEHGIAQDQVLSVSSDFRTVVTRDGQKINFGAHAG